MFVRVVVFLLLMAAVVTAHPPREVPSTMSAQDMERFLKGDDVGEGLPAETFGYPNPKAVLELERDLELTSEQKNKLQGIYRKMIFEASYVGKKLVAEELALDNFFRSGSLNADQLGNRIERIGGFRWRFRWAYLSAYVAARQVLTEDQLKKYQQLKAKASPATPDP